MGKYTITLPWPHKDLSPNSRKHWSKRAAIGRIVRSSAFVICIKEGARKLDWQGADVSITFCPPDNRRRDLDNMLASLKSSLDGISDATGIDDSKWALSISKAAPVPDGKVIVTLTPSSKEVAA